MFWQLYALYSLISSGCKRLNNHAPSSWRCEKDMSPKCWQTDHVRFQIKLWGGLCTMTRFFLSLLFFYLHVMPNGAFTLTFSYSAHPFIQRNYTLIIKGLGGNWTTGPAVGGRLWSRSLWDTDERKPDMWLQRNLTFKWSALLFSIHDMLAEFAPHLISKVPHRPSCCKMMNVHNLLLSPGTCKIARSHLFEYLKIFACSYYKCAERSSATEWCDTTREELSG